MELIKRNPLFKSIEKDQANSDAYEKSDCATLHGIFGKTILLVFIAIAAAAAAIAMMFNLTEDDLGTFVVALVVAAIASLVSGLIASFSVRLCPVFSIIYAVSEGFLLGVLSLLVDLAYPGVALVALICTFVVTFIMGILYFTGLVKVGHKLKTFVFVALISIFVGSIVLAILAACNVPGMRDILYEPSNPIGWIIDVALVLIATLLLLIDFDYAAQLADSEAEKKYEWKAAFALTTAIIYLYLRILEVLIRIAAASKK